jgi:CRISPR system Cascade subunit CasD
MNLKAPLMSWGEFSRYSDRTTLDHPSKSAIIGIICCAKGIRMKDEPDKVQELSKKIKVSSYTIKKGSECRDFQSIGTNYDKNDPIERRYLLRKKNVGTIADCPTKIFNKMYLEDAHFIVDLEIDDFATAESIQESLISPVWSLYLGRKCCIPSQPIPMKEGVLRSLNDVFEVIKKLLPVDESYVQAHIEDPEGMPYLDEPLGGMKYTTRYVKEIVKQFE